MKKVLILAGISTSDRNTPYAEYFGRDVEGYEFDQIYLDQLIVELSPEKFDITSTIDDRSIDTYDLVMIREYNGDNLDLAFVVSKYLQAKKTPFFNRNYLTYRPLSKAAQAVVFHEQRLNFPKTFYSLNTHALAKAAEKLNYPYILKDRLGMHGDNNFMIHSSEEALKILNSADVKFVAQEFIPNEYDYRILTMGNKEPLQIKRTAAPGSHLNNTSQGGTGLLVSELPADVLADAKKIAEALLLDVGGVDVLQSSTDGKYYFLEVNNQPQLVTGAEIKAKMGRFQDFLDSYFSKIG